ncbi:MAG: hypothetical protein U5P41_02515 [Gammaproteobacteria bacterium]|nr:hypothetical protein [Gammaproteobacteria bacterium]
MNYLQRQRLRLHAAAARLWPRQQADNSCVRLGGLEFRSPLGAAAGLDRHGRLLASFDKLGFGFVEVGTINNHSDAPVTARRLSRWLRKRHGKPPMRIGISIGSLRSYLDAMAINECVMLAQMFAPLADYIVLNLSRPRSPVRTGHFEPQHLQAVLQRVRAGCTANNPGTAPPLLVKIAITPGCRDAYPPGVMQLFENHCDGIVVAFEDWPSVTAAAGWLRGRRPVLPVIAVGGIRHATDIDTYLAAGAALVGVHRAIRSGHGLYSLIQYPSRRRHNGVDLGQ